MALAGSSTWMKIAELSNKVESLLTELDTLRKENYRVSNPVVMHMLEQALAALGVMTKMIDKTNSADNMDVLNDDGRHDEE